MTEEKSKLSQPVRITLAIVLWAVLLWLLSFGHPVLVPIAKAIFVVFVVPTGLVEWMKYKGMVSKQRSPAAKVVGMAIFAIIWYFFFQGQ